MFSRSLCSAGMVDFHLCVYTACLFVGRSQLRIGAGPRKTPNAWLANYWKEGQGRFQFAANVSQRRAEAARKGVAVFADRESCGYSNFARNPLGAWNICIRMAFISWRRLYTEICYFAEIYRNRKSALSTAIRKTQGESFSLVSILYTF